MRNINDDNLRLIALQSINGFGEQVDKHLQEIRGVNNSYIIPIEETRFNNGEGKIKISDSARGKDVYIMSDINNYSITYPMYNFINHKSPDDHFQDIKRVFAAIRDHSESTSLITPLLYESRQHRRKGRESLDCAVGLQDLVSFNVKNIITFDVHDINIQNAIPRSSFESFYPTKEIIEKFLTKEKIDFRNMFTISPDSGAVARANLYANLFRCKMGFFRKERDYSVIIDGKNPIKEHQYVGDDITGKNVIVLDDMIASGESILDVAKESKKRGANKIYLIVTFALFTGGIEKFNEAFKDNYFDRIYATNLTYIPEEYKKSEWLEIVDCSYKVAQIVNYLNEGQTLSPLLNDTEEISNNILKLIK